MTLRKLVRKAVWNGVVKLASGFDAGSRTLTRLRGWITFNTEINTLIVADGDIMRARSRKLSRENPWAGGAVDSFVANAIGTGIQPKSQHPDVAMRKKIEAAWKKWTTEADANGVSDYYGLQSLTARSQRVDGEVFIRLRFRRATDNLHVPLQLQLIEADHVPYWKTEDLPNGNYVRSGIQFNAIGKREGYYMYRDHPGSTNVKDGALYLIPADQVLHCMEVRRPGQLRGFPWLTPAIIMLFDIKQLIDAALMRAKVANLLSIFIKRPTGAGKGSDPLQAEDQGDGTAIKGLTPGGVNYLNPGEECEFLDPKEPGVNLETFVRMMLQAVARALGVTTEQLTGDLSKVNFSSIRAGVQEFRRWCEAWQWQVIIHQTCVPLWPIWIQQAVLAGVLGGAEVLKEYAANPDAFNAVRWDPQGWPYVNPLDDVRTTKEAIRNGFTSRQRENAAAGMRAEEIDEEQKEDNKRADEAGVKYDSDGRNPVNGQASSSDPNASDPNATDPKAGGADIVPADGGTKDKTGKNAAEVILH